MIDFYLARVCVTTMLVLSACPRRIKLVQLYTLTSEYITNSAKYQLWMIQICGFLESRKTCFYTLHIIITDNTKIYSNKGFWNEKYVEYQLAELSE